MVKGVTDSVPRPLHSHYGLVFAACHVVHGRVGGSWLEDGVWLLVPQVSGARDVRGWGAWSELQVSGATVVGGLMGCVFLYHKSRGAHVVGEWGVGPGLGCAGGQRIGCVV